MNVTYTFRPDSWKVFPPYTHFYEEKQTTKSFVMRSRIFLYEYTIDQFYPNFIDWMQFVFYDEDGKELTEEDEMIEKVIVYVKEPEHTLSYPYLDILQTMKTDIRNRKIRDDNIIYYWASLLNQALPFLLHGISYKNGKMKEHVMIAYDINMDTDIAQAEDGYGVDHTIHLTEQCKRRVRYMMKWLSEKNEKK